MNWDEGADELRNKNSIQNFTCKLRNEPDHTLCTDDRWKIIYYQLVKTKSYWILLSYGGKRRLSNLIPTKDIGVGSDYRVARWGLDEQALDPVRTRFMVPWIIYAFLCQRMNPLG